MATRIYRPNPVPRRMDLARLKSGFEVLMADWVRLCRRAGEIACRKLVNRRGVFLGQDAEKPRPYVRYAVSPNFVLPSYSEVQFLERKIKEQREARRQQRITRARKMPTKPPERPDLLDLPPAPAPKPAPPYAGGNDHCKYHGQYHPCDACAEEYHREEAERRKGTVGWEEFHKTKRWDPEDEKKMEEKQPPPPPNPLCALPHFRCNGCEEVFPITENVQAYAKHSCPGGGSGKLIPRNPDGTEINEAVVRSALWTEGGRKMPETLSVSQVCAAHGEGEPCSLCVEGKYADSTESVDEECPRCGEYCGNLYGDWVGCRTFPPEVATQPSKKEAVRIVRKEGGEGR